MSPIQISRTSLLIGLTLVLIIFMLEQFIAPPLQQRALSLRAKELDQSTEFGGDLGIWARSESQILHIGNTDSRGGLGTNDAEILILDEEGVLREYVYAKRFEIINDKVWRLHDVIKKEFVEDKMTLQRIDTLLWQTFLEKDQVSTLNKPPESLSPTDLFAYVSYLKDTGQQYHAYSLALWRKMGSGLTTLAMMLLSVAFVFGTNRTGLTRSLVLAGLTGIGIYLLDQMVSNAGLLLDLNPPLIALAPGVLLIVLSVSVLRRLT